MNGVLDLSVATLQPQMLAMAQQRIKSIVAVLVAEDSFGNLLVVCQPTLGGAQRCKNVAPKCVLDHALNVDRQKLKPLPITKMPIGSAKSMFSQRLFRIYMPPVMTSKRPALRPGIKPPQSVTTGSMLS